MPAATSNPGELRQDERAPKFEREPQEQTRPNHLRRIDDQGRDVNRDGRDGLES